MIHALTAIAKHYDRSALSELSDIPGRHYATSSVASATGINRNGTPYDAKREIRSFNRALNGVISLSFRSELLGGVRDSETEHPRVVGAKEWRFVFDSFGVLQLVGRTVEHHEQGKPHEYTEWVGERVSWIHRIRASSLCGSIACLHRREPDNIDPLRGLSLPSRRQQ
jgi:hypothetical protein